MKIVPQYIGGVINLPNLADQAVVHLRSLNCWNMYSRGKASCGRKASLKPIRRLLEQEGFSAQADQFITDVIVRMRTEQRADEAKS